MSKKINISESESLAKAKSLMDKLSYDKDDKRPIPLQETKPGDENIMFDLGELQVSLADLKQITRDLRLTPTSASFDDRLCDEFPIMEAVNDILPPDEVIHKICQKWNLASNCAIKLEKPHKISVYLIIAKIGENEKLIEDDMKRLGYFLGWSKEISLMGVPYLKLQFEPYCQLQEDITDEIKGKYKALYHWTPNYNVESIMRGGLVPNHQNSMFNFPPRTYLIATEPNSREMFVLGQKLCLKNENLKNNGDYTLLQVDTAGLNDNIRFYYDPNSSIAIYTEQLITKEHIKVLYSTDLMNGYLKNKN